MRQDNSDSGPDKWTTVWSARDAKTMAEVEGFKFQFDRGFKYHFLKSWTAVRTSPSRQRIQVLYAFSSFSSRLPFALSRQNSSLSGSSRHERKRLIHNKEFLIVSMHCGITSRARVRPLFSLAWKSNARLMLKAQCGLVHLSPLFSPAIQSEHARAIQCRPRPQSIDGGGPPHAQESKNAM